MYVAPERWVGLLQGDSMLRNLAPKGQGGNFSAFCSKENFIGVAPERQGEFTWKSGLVLLE
jgi:hypothetical protein